MAVSIRKSLLSVSALAVSLGAGLSAEADDTEIYFSQAARAGTSIARPNVLFILDTSGSMDTEVPAAGGKDRLQVMQEALNAVLDSTTGVNVGLMRFHEQGGPVLAPIANIDGTNADAGGGDTESFRSSLKNTVNALEHRGYTPIVSTLYEAARYYRGDEVFFGRTRGLGPTYTYPHDTRDETETHPASHVSHPSSYTGGTISLPEDCSSSESTASDCLNEQIQGTPIYASPLAASCQGNYIVLLSDGFPTRNYAEQLLEAGDGWIGQDCAGDGDGECGPELTQYLRTQDQGLSADLPGDQTIDTYTIGFNIEADGADYLKSLVEDSNSQYFDASSSDDVVTAFSSILADIKNKDNSFVAPSATVNVFNRLTHRDEIYFALFEPATSARWPGNLKRYQLRGGDSAGIYDVNGNLAVDAATALFNDTAQSFWSGAVDGNAVDSGGAASKLGASRNLYSYTDAYLSLGTTGVNLNDPDGRFDLHESNTINITKSLLGIPSATDAEHQMLLKWARGVEAVADENGGTVEVVRKHLSDVLHSSPVLVNYGGTDSDPDMTVFMSTNEGYIHAFDSSTGSEQFAFMPKELLPNLDALYRNVHAVDNRSYGMDGSISLWVNDSDRDGVVEPLDGDFVQLYATMRRGGRNVYALDVTDRQNPRLKWVIEGGSGDFAALGQTWSHPQLVTINYAGSPRKVLIFGGGYDTGQDTASDRQTDSVGNAIYVVDAATGARLWWASNDAGANLYLSAMTNSIASEVRVIDVNDNGLADRMYVGDMGGRVWRIDLDETHSVSSSALTLGGGVLADLNAGNEAGNRRFYYPPDVAKINRSGGYLSVSIGSGYRAHPLNQTIQDRFYVLRDTHVHSLPDFTNVAYDPITELNLYDATANLIAEGNSAERAAARNSLDASSGWYITLAGSGEKVLAQSVTFDYKVLFSSYTPVLPTGSDATCRVATSSAKLYGVSVEDGTPFAELDGADDGGLLTKGDRVYQLASSGIAPEPKLFFALADVDDNDQTPVVDDDSSVVADDGSVDTNSDGDADTDADAQDTRLPESVLVLVGRELVPITFPLTLTKTYWRTD